MAHGNGLDADNKRAAWQKQKNGALVIRGGKDRYDTFAHDSDALPFIWLLWGE